MRGADPRLRNGEGQTALQAALANGQTECADLVRDFLRRPTFEPDPQSGASSVSTTTLPSNPLAATTITSNSSNNNNHSKGGLLVAAEKGDGGSGTPGGANTGVGGGTGGVTGVAPEVCRANAVFCLGRRRRRLGSRVRPGRGLGVGVGTAAAEVGLGARRCARLQTTNPCTGTAMEAFVLWSIARGEDPFRSEGEWEEVGGGGGSEEERSQQRRSCGAGGSGSSVGTAGGGREPAGVWLEYYMSAYNER